MHADTSGRIYVVGWDGTALCLDPNGIPLLYWTVPGAWARITTDAAGLIYLAGTSADVRVYGSPTPVQPATWSAVKALFD
ncbi:MAG TPA: hypothetical protein VF720_06775 [Candidatus Eisenbacteria bacterium]